MEIEKEDSYRIFEVMNDRWVLLKPNELLKCYLLNWMVSEEKAKKVSINFMWILDIFNNTYEYVLWKKILAKNIKWVDDLIWKIIKIKFFKQKSRKWMTDKEKLIYSYHKWINANRDELNLKNDEWVELFTQKLEFFANKMNDLFSKLFINDNDNNKTYLFYLEKYLKLWTKITEASISAIKIEDTEDIITRKIMLISRYFENLTVLWLINWSGWINNFNELLEDICDVDIIQLLTILKEKYKWLDTNNFWVNIISNWKLKNTESKYILANIYMYINEITNHTFSDKINVYLDYWKIKENKVTLEHIIYNNHEWYEKDYHLTQTQLKWLREWIGMKLLLLKNVNSSLGDKEMTEKVKYYWDESELLPRLANKDNHSNGNNIYINELKNYGIKVENLIISKEKKLTKNEIEKRTKEYIKILNNIYNFNNINIEDIDTIYSRFE